MKHLFFSIIIILTSCSSDRSENENDLEPYIISGSFSFDIPQQKEKYIEIAINAENQYILGNKKYSYDQLISVIDQCKCDRNLLDLTVKITADKNADYPTVFDLISIAKEKKVKPILLFSH